MNHHESSVPSPAQSRPTGGVQDLTDQTTLRLAAQAAFLQAFAENLVEPECSVEEVLHSKKIGETDFGWRAGLRW